MLKKVGGTMNLQSSWLVTGASVRGANHERKNLPNQDAIKWEEDQEHLVLAVSDGHGSLKHFRSAIGAKLAVEAAVEVMLQEVDVKKLTEETLTKVKSRVKDKLPQRVINCWQNKVKQHYQNNLFSLDREAQMKLNKIEAEKGSKYRHKIETNYSKAYGATLLIVLVSQKFILYFKLGDGDIVVFSSAGKERLFAEEEKLGPATDSLCMTGASEQVDISLMPFSKQIPLFVLLSTDGYINSFRNEADYLQVVDDLVDLTVQHGLEYINNNLEQWLTQTSQQGSGDDITLGLIYNQQLLQQQIKSRERGD